MLRAVELTYQVGERRLLDRCSCELEAGTITAVLGANGAGKSTLLRLLAGELRPTHGQVLIDGIELRHWRAAELARRRAVVTQFNHIAFPFTAEEIVALGRAPHRATDTRARRVEAVAAALARMDVSELALRIYPTLSGGEQQRVSVARALVQIDFAGGTQSGRYLLLDEPTASLDLRHQHELLRLLADLAASGCTILAVLHDLNLALAYADHVVMLKHGAIAAMGAVATTLTADNVERVFDVAAERLVTANGGAVLAVSG